MNYTAPTPDDLRAMKEALGLSGTQMAELFGLAGNNQWRKYTGGQAPREMGVHMLFFACARLTLPPELLAAVCDRMRAAGAAFDLEEPGFTLPGSEPGTASHS